MKITTIAVLGFVLMSLFACSRQNAPASPDSTVKAETKTVRIPIEGMSCGACAASVKKAIKAVTGVAEVEVSLERRDARVRYNDASVSPERLTAAVNKLGYKAGPPRMEEKP